MKGTYMIINPNEKILVSKGPAGGAPMGTPPAGGPPSSGGMPTGPLPKELKLVWDGETALWTNEMGEEVRLEQVEATDDTLKFIAMAGPAPIEWTLTKDGVTYSAVSHRGADIHGNPPVDTTCTVTKVP